MSCSHDGGECSLFLVAHTQPVCRERKLCRSSQADCFDTFCCSHNNFYQLAKQAETSHEDCPTGPTTTAAQATQDGTGLE